MFRYSEVGTVVSRDACAILRDCRFQQTRSNLPLCYLNRTHVQGIFGERLNTKNILAKMFPWFNKATFFFLCCHLKEIADEGNLHTLIDFKRANFAGITRYHSCNVETRVTNCELSCGLLSTRGRWALVVNSISRLRLKCDGTRAHKPDFVFRRYGRAHLNRQRASVQSTTGSRSVRISGSNGG